MLPSPLCVALLLAGASIEATPPTCDARLVLSSIDVVDGDELIVRLEIPGERIIYVMDHPQVSFCRAIPTRDAKPGDQPPSPTTRLVDSDALPSATALASTDTPNRPMEVSWTEAEVQIDEVEWVARPGIYRIRYTYATAPPEIGKQVMLCSVYSTAFRLRRDVTSWVLRHEAF